MSWFNFSALSKPKVNLWLVIIVAGSFFLSAGYSFWHRIEPVVDAQAYDRIAVNLIEGFGFREDRTKSYEFDTAIVRAGPAYEFFLAGIYSLFGHYYGPAWTIQAILHAVTAWLIFLICRRVFSSGGEIIGLVGAALVGFSPDLIEISAMLMTETLYLFFTVLVVYLFVRAFQFPTSRFLAVLLGAVLGLAILTRPPLLLFSFVFLFFYWRQKSYQASALFLSSLTAVLLPWTVRNYLLYHQFILTTLIGQYNLWVGNTLLSDGGQIAGGFNPATTYAEADGFFNFKAKANLEFLTFITSYPLVFLKLCLLRLVRYFSLIRPMGFWFYQQGLGQLAVVVSSLVYIALLFSAGFAGLVTLVKEKRAVIYYLVALALTSPLVLLPTVVQSRYRFQIYPFLVLFGAYFIVIAMRQKGWRKQPSFYFPTLFLVTVSVIDVSLNAGAVVERWRMLLLSLL